MSAAPKRSSFCTRGIKKRCSVRRQFERLRRQSETEAIEVIDLRFDRDHVGDPAAESRARRADRGARQCAPIARGTGRVEREEVDLVRRDDVSLRERCERFRDLRAELRLGDQLLPRHDDGIHVAVDVATEFFGHRERREPGATERDEELLLIVAVRLREGGEILIIHRDLDATRAVFFAFAHRRDVQAREQRDPEHDGEDQPVSPGRAHRYHRVTNARIARVTSAAERSSCK